MDIYDELEPLAPQERKEAFLRLARQLKEYGDHNPELLRIVEAMGFLSLYTAELPKRLSDTFIQAQERLTTELKGLCATTVGAANGELHQFHSPNTIPAGERSSSIQRASTGARYKP